MRALGRRTAWWGALAASALVVTACGPTLPGVVRPGTVAVVAAENQYGDVASQVGGRYVSVASVESNPNVDPHDFEVSPAIARAVSGARLVIENGLGYDAFMADIAAASPNSTREVLDVQHLMGLPDDTKNPHLWYAPSTMPVVAEAIAAALGRIEPMHAAYFANRARAFDTSLGPFRAAIATFKAAHGGISVATTEPVADDLLSALGVVNRTPWRFQADVMNGVDPSAQDESAVTALLRDRGVAALVYNRQVTDPLTESLLVAARVGRVPTVGVTETMPVGDTYQRWMLAELSALSRAIRSP